MFMLKSFFIEENGTWPGAIYLRATGGSLLSPRRVRLASSRKSLRFAKHRQWATAASNSATTKPISLETIPIPSLLFNCIENAKRKRGRRSTFYCFFERSD